MLYPPAEFSALPTTITKPTFVEAWFFTTSEKDYNRAAIRNVLAFNPAMTRYIDQEYGHLFAGVTVVSVHMRLGYNGEPNAKHILERASPRLGYYVEAMIKTLGDLTGPVRYLVFADDAVRAQSMLASAPALNSLDVVVMNVNMFSGLYLMTQCQHHVLATSTFSFWGAYLAVKPGRVIYHSTFTNAHGQYVLPPREQLGPEERWIKLNTMT